MARALGIGGIFFKCRDVEAIGTWYQDHLGIELSDFGGSELRPERLPAGAYTVWGPFASDTRYFEPSDRDFMINLIVDDVEQALEQVAAGGAEVVGEIEEIEFGTFGWFIDPEGTKVELWKPAEPGESSTAD